MSILVLLCGSANTPGSCHLKCEQRDEHMNSRGLWLNSWQTPTDIPVVTWNNQVRYLADDGTWSLTGKEGEQ